MASIDSEPRYTTNVAMASTDPDPVFSNLQVATTNLHNLLRASLTLEDDLANMDKRFQVLLETLSATSREMVPLQSLAIANKALDTRINRAVSPALKLLQSFKLVESLQQKLIVFSNKLPNSIVPEKRLTYLVKYVDCVDRLNSAIDSVIKESEPAVQKLQEVVEFLSRTKATDQFRTQRIRETLVTLKALYETEVDALKYEGLLDEALLCLQGEYDRILQHLKHRNIGESQEIVEETEEVDLASELELEVLRRISETLAANDCLDICIDIFVKVRYKRAAKALMRLNPDYLRTYVPEEIDQMEWESLETAISLWIEHFELAVKGVLTSEKDLCKKVLSGLMGGVLWAECFVKIADKIMAVFFRFGEGVARSSKEPQKLFKLLDMLDSLEKMKAKFSQVFEGDAGVDICSRFRELEKLLVHASCKVFWEFGLQIEGNQDGFPPPQDGSVTKLVRYAVNYLKYLASDNYRTPMAKVLGTEQIWKMGILSRQEKEENLLQDAIINVMEALQRNVEVKKSRYRDKVLPYIFAMNTYWYIYMRCKNSDLGNLVGEQWLKAKFKSVAEESAYNYQKQAWGQVLRFLDEDDEGQQKPQDGKDSTGTMVRAKLDAFVKGIDESMERHRSVYNIPDVDLREQIKEAVMKLVVPTYESFIQSYLHLLQTKSYLSTESVRELVDQVFEERNPRGLDVRASVRRRDLRGRLGRGGSMDGSTETLEGYRR
ncbi:exocyst complex component EXO70I-like [Aristolochia californica]|uniref:exocyst complex component EXO70I-like n=1 Tax=Aristolochia californica TaxID=171875 RepID=UPI0035DE3568